MGTGGGGSQNTTTQVQQIPEFEQQFAQENQDIARSIASQPYPTYQGQLIAGFSPQQQQGMQQAQDASMAYQPYLNAASGLTMAATHPWDAQTAQQYMSPYAEAALAPQMQALALQQAQHQKSTDAQATQAGAFGDARHGVESGLNNFYGDMAMNDLQQQGMNQAYNTGLGAYQQQQQLLGNAGSQMANIGNQATTLGEQGAQANFNAGTQQQQMTQQQLSTAYNNYLNQVNWPQQQLNLRMSALSLSPYNKSAYTTLAPGNATAQNVGAFAGVSGALGNLLGGSGQSSAAPLGGTPAASDIRLKRNLKLIGHTDKGVPVYKFHYIWDEKDSAPWIGCMAQDVEKIMPEAVKTLSNGYKIIDYGRMH